MTRIRHRLSVTICLPGDARSIGSVRRLCRLALEEGGADREAVDSVEVALSELCTNIVRHSRSADQYEVRIDVGDGYCQIRVVDANGHRFAFGELGRVEAPGDADGGRGLHLARALVDELDFSFSPDGGLSALMVKRFSPN